MRESGHKKPYILGLTGGIGSGKSTISKIFCELGVDVIDADEISRSLLKKNTSLLNDVVDHFGFNILDAEGNLDRSILRHIIFNNPNERKWLENLTHPAIRKIIDEAITASKSAYIILVVPLLLETGHYNFVNKILVVDVPEAIQIKRTKQRDGNSEELIKQIMSTQISRDERLKLADDIIDNSASLEKIKIQILDLHEKYLQESKQTG